MKTDHKNHANQLSLDFDSKSGYGKNEGNEACAVVLKLAYSSDSIKSRHADSSEKEKIEREIIISRTISFARKLSW